MIGWSQKYDRLLGPGMLFRHMLHNKRASTSIMHDTCLHYLLMAFVLAVGISPRETPLWWYTVLRTRLLYSTYDSLLKFGVRTTYGILSYTYHFTHVLKKS